ncbi:hypothetical protein Y032_0009g452 [Ancylostoma ceylanicum]|uniref:Uncharacterized protein n=1 Tax=Ancylostoma ceylanicum TaxID=53326 RepID=A0A016VHS0_9BILA|nr:hypothetical protein Y032_0009g452 [Ancylostoma ceylanicum]
MCRSTREKVVDKILSLYCIKNLRAYKIYEQFIVLGERHEQFLTMNNSITYCQIDKNVHFRIENKDCKDSSDKNDLHIY